MLKYFVSYQWSDMQYRTGHGNIEMDRVKPITGISDTKEMAEQIKKTPGTNIPENAVVVILFWRRFEDD